MMYGFCASPLVWSLCARTIFHPDFFRVLLTQPCRAHQDKIRRLHAPDGLHHCMSSVRIVFTASSHVRPPRVLCLCHRRLPRTTMHDDERKGAGGSVGLLARGRPCAWLPPIWQRLAPGLRHFLRAAIGACARPGPARRSRQPLTGRCTYALRS